MNAPQGPPEPQPEDGPDDAHRLESQFQLIRLLIAHKRIRDEASPELAAEADDDGAKS